MGENKRQWQAVIIMSLAYIATNINFQGFMALFPFVREDLLLSKAQIGLYSTLFFTGATLLGILTGRYADLSGAKKGMVIGVSCVGGLMLLHFAASFTCLLILAFLSGIAFSLVAPSVNRGIVLLVQPENRAVSLGVAQTGVSIGGFLGAAILPLLGGFLGWRLAVLFSGLFAIMTGVIIQRYIPEVDNPLASESRDGSSFFKCIIRLLADKTLVKIFVLGIVFASISSFVITHFTIFLNDDLRLSKTIAGFGLGMLQIGGLVGQPGWGWLNDRYLSADRNKGLITIGFILAGILFIFGTFFYSVSFPLIVLFFMIFLLGFASVGWLGFYLVAVSEASRQENTGVTIALALIFVRLGMMLSPPVFGYLSDLYSSYQLGWIVLGMIVVAVTLLFFIFRERDTDIKSTLKA